MHNKDNKNEPIKPSSCCSHSHGGPGKKAIKGLILLVLLAAFGFVLFKAGMCASGGKMCPFMQTK